MLIFWVGTDNNETQSDPGFTNISDKESRLSLDDNTRSSTDRSIRPRRPTIERSEYVIEEETPASASDPVPETLDSKFIRLGLGFSKKSKKKSRVSAIRAAFKED